MPFNDNFHDLAWADATFVTDLVDDPTADPTTTVGFFAALEPDLLVDTLHPFDGLADPDELAELVAAADADVAELLRQEDEPPAVEIVVPGGFFRRPEEASWAAA